MAFKKSQYRRLDRSEKCAVCGCPDWCTVSADGELAHCMRIESGKTCKGGGWIHVLAEPFPLREVVEKPEKPVVVDAEAVAKAAYRHKLARAKRKSVAQALGVSVKSMEALRVGIGWDQWNGKEWASFPSRDGSGRVVGITRRYDSGVKKTLKGTRNNGLFLFPYWFRGEPLYIVEGGSDVAAMFDRGYAVLGRPSNVGGLKAMVEMLRRHPPTGRVVVIGENDRKPDRPGTKEQCPVRCRGCSWCWPGKFGAHETAKRLSIAIRKQASVLMPPEKVKDVRQWLASGLPFPR